MSDTATPRLALPYLAASQAQKHVTLNQAMAALDGLIQTAVLSRVLAVQPSAPTDGQMWMLPAAASGAAWAGAPIGTVMRFEAGAWAALPVVVGQTVFVRDEKKLLTFMGDSWVDTTGAPPTSLQNLTLLGLGATADANNPLSVQLNSALFSAKTPGAGGSGDIRLTLNKSTVGATASLIFQDAWSGRAEMGLAGDDNFHFKVSPDGGSWREALLIDRATGNVSFPSGMTLPTPIPPQGMRNRLLNGAFRIWQRGVSFACAAGVTSFTADRWAVTPTGAATTAAPSTTGLPIGAASALAVTGAAGVTALSVGQPLESATLSDLAGQGCTLSAWLYSSVAVTPQLNISAFSAVDVSAGRVVALTAAMPTVGPGWTRVVASFVMPAACANGAMVEVAFGATAAGVTRGVTLAQLESGASSTAFEVRHPGLELHLCQRYFQTTSAMYGAIGAWSSVTSAVMAGFLPSTMRTTPTITPLTGAALSVDCPTQGASTTSSFQINANPSGFQITANNLSPGRITSLPAGCNTPLACSAEL